jgi:DNA-directed RNA polymerase specialized sigma24 family protein
MTAAPSRFEQAQPVFQRRIASYARQKFRSLPGTDACELEQELLEVLWLCCTTYDPDKGAKFQTYFWTAAERRFIDLHRAASRQMRVGDYSRVCLHGDDVRDELALRIEGPSAEDQALANMRVIEIFRSGPK